MFSLLYFSQGAAMAYFQNFQKPYLAGLGVSVSQIGLLTSILLMPFVLKMIFALISDRFALWGMGHRKPYMLMGLSLACLAFVFCAFNLPSENYALFAVIVVTASFGIALYDATTDGYAVESTEEKDQGIVQGAMVGGRALGVISMSLLFGSLAASDGYRTVFLAIAACILLPLFFVARIQDGGRVKAVQKITAADFKIFISSGYLLFIVYAIAYSFVSFGHDGIITLHLSESLGLDAAALGEYGAFRGGGAILGALLGGLLLSLVNRWFVAYGALILISFGVWTSIDILSASNFHWMGLGWGAIWGLQETVFVTLAMSRSSPKLAAASFAFLMACSNIGTSLGDGWATTQREFHSFPAIFQHLAILALLVPLTLFFVQRSLSKKTG